MLVQSAASTQCKSEKRCRYFMIHYAEQEAFGSGLAMGYWAIHLYVTAEDGGQVSCYHPMAV